MAKKFNNEYLNQAYADLSDHTRKTTLEADVEKALAHFDTAFSKAKTDAEKAAISNEMAQLLEDCAEEFAAGLAASAEKDCAERAKKLSKALMTAIEFSPQNAPRFIEGVLSLESLHPEGNSGVFTDLAQKLIVKYPRQSEMVLDAADECVKEYERHSKKSTPTYQGFYEVYTTAYRKPFSGKIKDRALESANEIYYKLDFMKKALQRINEKPQDENLLNTFENNLKIMMRQNPQTTFAEVLENVKAVSRIEDEDARSAVYNAVLDSMVKDLPDSTEAELKAKSDTIFTFVGKVMKAEKDKETLESFAVSALYAIHAGATDDNSGIILADGRENQAFGALNKIAAVAGHRGEIRLLLTVAAAKYRESPEIKTMIRTVMIKALESAELSGKGSTKHHEPTRFEKEMTNVYGRMKNIRRLNNEICEIMNIEYPNHSDYKYDLSRPFKPNKKDMERAVNKLSEYPQIADHLPTLIISRMDTQGYGNIDDKILDKFIAAAARIKSDDRSEEENAQYRDRITSQLTSIKTQMHASGIKEKIAFDKNDAKLAQEESATPRKKAAPKAKDATAPKAQIKTMMPTESKDSDDHAPKKFKISFKDDSNVGGGR